VKGYRSDLAYIHDVGFGGFSERAAPALLRILRDSGVRSGLVVDLGCGSGLWAHRLVEQGYDVLGIDISAAMVKLARRREPRARFKVGSFLSVPLPRCLAITAIGECLSYLFDERNREEALAGFFARAHEASNLTEYWYLTYLSQDELFLAGTQSGTLGSEIGQCS
jgi:SAM-dependent methyltransferase